uniref:BMA-LPD-8, isoform d n=1 Tax=Brugia malayi TaxID=6279 RepID=A0A1I9G642_BRUMA|nr:BMA-LPD-8, isoform d [Brugia malayi]
MWDQHLFLIVNKNRCLLDVSPSTSLIQRSAGNS